MLDEFPNRTRARLGPKSDVATERSDSLIRADRLHAIQQLAQEMARHENYLRDLARRYNWWQTPDVALRFPVRLIAQVMNLGTFEDINRLSRTLGDDFLRRVLENVEAGQLNPRSWHYWHYRLNGVRPGHVPPMPRRLIA
jgi:hypothetical protein